MRPSATRPLPAARRRTATWTILVVLVLLASTSAVGQETNQRIGDDLDPVLGAVQISQASHADGAASHAVVGRDDVFADNLAATSLVGRFGTLLLTTGGSDAPLRPEVLTELGRALGDRGACTESDSPEVYLAGGPAAVSSAAEQTLLDAGYCVSRLGGVDRIATAILIADATVAVSSTVILARAGDWADAAAIGAWAAATNTRILVTPTASLAPAVDEALRRYDPEEILLIGGPAALSQDVESAAADIAPVRRVAGEARDGTAVAIAQQVWGEAAGEGIAIGNGYASTSWAYLFAAAPLTGRQGLPVLYATASGPTATSQAYIDGAAPEFLQPVGPADPRTDAPSPEPAPTDDVTDTLSEVRVALERVATMRAPLAMVARPDTAELWVAERAGTVRTLGSGETREVLDIASTVSTSGERGLLGMAFSADGRTLYTSSNDRSGTSVIDAFDIVDGAAGDVADLNSRRRVITVAQPASNHNGGDLHLGPDGYLWWSLGDGGGGGDTYGNGQRPDTLLGTLVRIDPTQNPYGIPPDNPFVDGGGAPEVWAFGLRNPFRFAFDQATDDLYIADVGQSQREEVDMLRAGTGAGSNFGWPAFEGTRPFSGAAIQGHVPPVWETRHSAGNCSITGGVVYRGQAIPGLRGAYLYADLCNNDVQAIVVQDGQVTQDADLNVGVSSPVGFATDHEGEVYVLSLSGDIVKIVPA